MTNVYLKRFNLHINECSVTNYDGGKRQVINKVLKEKCPQCEKQLVFRQRVVEKVAKRPFIGCTGFPYCSYTRNY